MHYKKISEELVDDNGWWKYRKEVYERPNQTQGEYFYAETNGAVMIVAVREDGRIALTRQYRYLMDKNSIEFPCGRIETGEDVLEAAKRELLEETGCSADDYVNLGSFEPSNGLAKDETNIYAAHIVSEKPLMENGEISEVLFRRPDEIMDMIRNNEIKCGQTLAAWALAQNYFASMKVEGVEEVPPGFRTLFDYFLGSE